ncbi:methyl-accepting chemotaxis protein [Acidovorax radicis]|uniref:methyl-accepting chemotaxis protein n=1 Tax=Acidovorax radicis TaxID=758826 RepID=UPI0002376D53|nr:methyl-accepting chemotaxis protein [Acidovorax radicis]
MMTSLRTRILLITTAAVTAALALTGAATYAIVRSATLQTIEDNLTAIASGNALAIEKWVSSKSLAVQAAAAAVEHGDPQGIVLHMNKANGFPVTTVGWQDKRWVSSSPTTPPTYDPTARPWYQSVVKAGKLLVTKPYGDASTGEPFVSFAAPILRDGAAQGAVSGAVPLKGVQDVVAAVHPTPSSLGFVVDKDGLVLAHPDAQRMLKPASELSPALTPAVLAALPVANHALEATLAGSAKLLRALPVAGTDWYLVVALDKAEATAGLAGVLRTSAIAIVLLALAAAGVSALLTAQSFRRLSQVRDAMDEIGSGGGDLTHRLPVTGHDEVAQIASSFNAFVDKISTVLQDVRQGVESMKTATDEIKAGNHDLSHRTETSASNLQETSASLSQLTATVQQSADAAAQAAQLARSASATATRGGEVVADAASTMDEISNASARIGEIIGVIDSIAFQTNILALNAAVEAARAGENGRGFAVVASEVRSLAHRSATAAREVRALIDASGASVATGTQRVRAVGETMNEIVHGIQRVAQIVGEINGSMTEQSSGIGQINQAVAEMDRATQQNAALVEESTAASGVLNDQAHHLARTVAGFQLEASRAPIHAGLPALPR